jgi:hypothetical protein
MALILETVFVANINYLYHTSGVRVHTKWLWSSTGTYFTYANWGLNQPDNPAYPNQACVHYWHNDLGDNDCTDINRFICEENIVPC